MENNNHALQVITVEQLYKLKALGLVVVQDTWSSEAWEKSVYPRQWPESRSAPAIWNTQLAASINKQSTLAAKDGIDFGDTVWGEVKSNKPLETNKWFSNVLAKWKSRP